MQAIMITYDQAHHENVLEALNSCLCRGFTSFGTVQGRGSKTGEPHYGSHAWPALGSRLGLRAFVWPITATI